MHCFEQKPRFDYVNTTCQTRTFLHYHGNPYVFVVFFSKFWYTKMLSGPVDLYSLNFGPIRRETMTGREDRVAKIAAFIV